MNKSSAQKKAPGVFIEESNKLMHNEIYLSIVVPAYNEECCILGTLKEILRFFNGRSVPFEIIIVDDGSCDKTYSLCKRFSKEQLNLEVLRSERNFGKGFAVKKGIARATGKYILFMDADSSTAIEEITKMLPFLENREADIAIGSRWVKGSRIVLAQPWYRVLMSRISNKIVKVLFFKGYQDQQCGFKCFTYQAAKSIFPLLKIHRFAFDQEVLVIAKRKGYRVKEVPVVWKNNLPSHVNPFLDPLRAIVDFFRIKCYAQKGFYDVKIPFNE